MTKLDDRVFEDERLIFEHIFGNVEDVVER